MRNLPCPAPTNQPGTCLFCGKTLRPEGNGAWAWVRLEDATPEQLAVWPIIHWYVRDAADDSRELYQYSTYDSGARFVNQNAPRGLSDYTGSWSRRTVRGDDTFCSKVCAVQFARIAANMGFRLPTHTEAERKAAQQHRKFMQEFTPYELEAAPLGEVVVEGPDWVCGSRSKTCRISNWTQHNGRRYEGPRQPPKSKRVREFRR